MSYGIRATWDAIRELAFNALDDAYLPVGTPTTKAIRAIKFTNNTNQTVYFTDDNTANELKLPGGSFELWDVTTNKALGDKPQFIDIGTQFYCKYDGQVAPTSGWVAIEALIVEIGS